MLRKRMHAFLFNYFYLTLCTMVFIMTGLFSYFILQGHMYAFNNYSIVKAQFKNQGPKITNNNLQTKIFNYVDHFPQTGKWQNKENLTVINHNHALQSVIYHVFLPSISLSFLELPNKKIIQMSDGYYELQADCDKDEAIINKYSDKIAKLDKKNSNYIELLKKYSHKINAAEIEDDTDSQLMEDLENLKHHTWHEFRRVILYRVGSNHLINIDPTSDWYLAKYGSTNHKLYSNRPVINTNTIQNLIIYHDKNNKDQYIACFNFKDKHSRKLIHAKEIINIKDKCVKYGLYKSNYITTFTQHYFGEKLM